jgi:hypothetical protein
VLTLTQSVWMNKDATRHTRVHEEIIANTHLVSP